MHTVLDVSLKDWLSNMIGQSFKFSTGTWDESFIDRVSSLEMWGLFGGEVTMTKTASFPAIYLFNISHINFRFTLT